MRSHYHVPAKRPLPSPPARAAHNAMSVAIPRVRNASIRKYSHVVRSMGRDPLRMLNKVGLDQLCLQADDIRVPEASFATLLEISATEFSDAPVGLLIGADWRLSDFGPISLALQHQASLASALRTMREYRHLLSSTVALEVVRHERLAIVQLNLDTGRDLPGRHPTELGLAALLSLCRHQLGRDWRPDSVHFTHAAPASLGRHQAVFRCNVVFNSDFDGIVLARDDLQRLNPDHDPAMERYARHFLAPQPSDEAAAVSLAQQVRSAIQSLLPHGYHQIGQVAKTLGHTTRSLQRQLEEEGTNYQTALNAVRAGTAVRSLKNGSLSIGDVAMLSGFSEVSSFSRWFFQHFQQTPSSWRAQNLRG